MHKSAHTVGATKDLCEVIDKGSSVLSAERSGSALVAHNGSLVALMGRQKHCNVSPQGTLPRTKTAWAVPASVIAKMLEQISEN